MPVVFVKDPQSTGREELVVGELNETPVRVLKGIIAEKIGAKEENLMLIYAGRVLKQGKALDDYNIINGATIFYTKKKEVGTQQATAAADTPSFSHALSKIHLMLRNPKVFRLLRRLLTTPSLMDSMLKGSPIATSTGYQMLLSDSTLRESTNSPDNLIRALESRPQQTITIDRILYLLGSDTRETNLDGEGEGGVVYTGENMRRLEDAQEQMFHHSMALQAHQQEHQDTEPMDTATPTSHPPANLSRQGSNGSGITPNMLASALSSVSSSQTPPSSSQSGPSSLHSMEQEGTTPPSGPSSLPGRSHTTGGITPADLLQALQSATPSSNRSSRSPSSSLPPQNPPTNRHARRQHKYRKQLEQLKGMGLSDEAAILHALEATKGNIDAALELLIGQHYS